MCRNTKLIKDARTMFMDYLDDLALTGMNDKDAHGRECLKLFWPPLEHTIYRHEHDLQNWMRMLRDGQDTCCFAVAVDTCLVYPKPSRNFCLNSERRRSDGISRHTKTNLFSTTINLQESPTASLPLTPGGILKLNSGRLSISSEYRKGHAQLAEFWLPDVLDKLNELVNASDVHRRGPRTHTELLDSDRSTGRFVAVCIADR